MKKLFTILAVAVISLTACKKTEKGEQGEPGKDGSANITTTLLTVNSFTVDPIDNTFYSSVGTGISALTTSVCANGAVMLYMYSSSDNSNVSIPFSITGINYTFSYKPNQIEIQVHGTSVNQSYIDGIVPMQLRLVTIPPAALKKHPDIKNYSYQQVQQIISQ